jgi:hypothetical protein
MNSWIWLLAVFFLGVFTSAAVKGVLSSVKSKAGG